MLPRRALRSALAAALAAVLLTSVGPTAAAQVRVNQDAQLIADFTKHTQEYCELHRKLESSLPPRPDKPTPEQIDAAMPRWAEIQNQLFR